MKTIVFGVQFPNSVLLNSRTGLPKRRNFQFVVDMPVFSDMMLAIEANGDFEMTVHLDPKMVPASLRGTYQGKKFQAKVCESVTIPMDAGLWSGGSRELYTLVKLDNGESLPFPNQNSSPWSRDRRETVVPLQTGFAIVRHSIFCGKDMGLTFYIRPENATKMLPAPIELSENQRKVLAITRAYKSGYRKEAAFNAGISSATWQEIQNELIADGMLNRNGSITTKGRNAVGDFRV